MGYRKFRQYAEAIRHQLSRSESEVSLLLPIGALTNTLNFLQKIAPEHKGEKYFVIQALETAYNVNNDNVRKLKKIAKNGYVQRELNQQVRDSDIQIAYAFEHIEYFTLWIKEYSVYRQLQSGGFFPYINKSGIELDRYDIYDKFDTVHYINNCLEKVLEQSGVKLLEDYGNIIQNSTVTFKGLERIAKQINVQFVVSTILASGKYDTKKIGDKLAPLIKMGLYKEHYFIQEPTEYTEAFITTGVNKGKKLSSLALIKKIVESGKVQELTRDQMNATQYYQKEFVLGAEPFAYDKTLSEATDDYEAKEVFLKEVVFADFETCPQKKHIPIMVTRSVCSMEESLANEEIWKKKRMEEIEKTKQARVKAAALKAIEAEYGPMEDAPVKSLRVQEKEARTRALTVVSRSRKAAKAKSTKAKVPKAPKVPKGPKTPEYKLLPSYVNPKDSKIKRITFMVTEKDPDQFIRDFLDSLPHNSLTLFHNFQYDASFLLKFLKVSTYIENCGIKYLTATYKEKKLMFKDSMSFISGTQASFSEKFNLPISKDVCAYNLYTRQTMFKKHLPIVDALEVLRTEKGKTDSEKEKRVVQFLDNLDVNKFRVDSNGVKDLKGDHFEHMEYMKFYCEADVALLQAGYTTFKRWMYEITGIDIDKNGIITISALVQQYLLKRGCYVGVEKVSGKLREAFAQSVVGGRVMTMENKVMHVTQVLNDFDAVSLYPSAMVRFRGFPKGKAKIIANWDQVFNDPKVHYWAHIRITAVNIHRKFPLQSYVDSDKHTRTFTNDMIGREIFVDKYALEDYIKFQGVEFEFLGGYFFNEGFNTKVCEVMAELFQERVNKKKKTTEFPKGNPIQEAYKLLMNSAYGKTIQKEIKVNVKIIAASRVRVFEARNYNYILDSVKSSCGMFTVFRLKKGISDHSNYAHCGTMILAMSKRIMNEVMCLAEDNGIEIFYQDTDSMHIQANRVADLGVLFKEKYGKVLIGGAMGQFHNDFTSKLITGPVVSKQSWFLSKKCYMDVLVSALSIGDLDPDTELPVTQENLDLVDYHFRLKGVNGSSIVHNGGIECYKKMFAFEWNGVKPGPKDPKVGFKFDLCDAKVVFEKSRAKEYTTRDTFIRYIKFAGPRFEY